ncbi:MAG: M28 family peptidase [Spirochaetaceae bacterium]|nr:M28 family peptidase [Spirochaetaceae bacterium]
MKSFKNIFHREKTKKDIFNDKVINAKRRPLVETLKAGRLAEEAVSMCRDMVDRIGGRRSGSKECLQAADEIAEELSKYCDFTHQQNFPIKAEAYTFWLKILPYVYIVSLGLLLIGLPLASLLFYSSFGYYVYREFIQYKPMAEKFFKTENGCNVHGVIEPKEEVFHTLLFTSHHDSALLPKYNKADNVNYFKKVTLPLILFGSSSLLIVVQLITEILTGRFLGAGLPSATSIVFIIILLILSYFVFSLQKLFSDKVSPGAGDNLISTTTIIQISRFFKWNVDCNDPLKHTRLIFVSFDGEEVGLRGSRTWFDKHKALLKDATQINLDCLYSSNQLSFIDTDINGTQPLSGDLAQKGVRLAVSMGYKAKMHHMPFLSGGTDAAEGYRAGIKAISLMAIDFKNINTSHLHSGQDIVDNIETKAIEQVISIAIKMAVAIDTDKFEDEYITNKPHKEPVNKEDTDEMKEKDDEDDKNQPKINFKKITRR